MYKTFSMELAGRTLSVDVGRVAAQANGAAFMHYGETTVLSTATASEKPREGIDFFPLSVEFEEKLYAVGKIPGGFNKREGKASENSVLTSRVIDRPMRPLFPKDYRNDVTLVNMVMSVDPECNPEIPAMLGSSIATCISDIPFDGPCATTQVGLIDGEFVINPSLAQKELSDLQLTVASTREKVIMIEAGANEVPEDTMIEAIYKAHDVNQEIIRFIDKIVAECGKEKHLYASCAVPEELFEAIKKIVPPEEMEEAVFTDDKQTREENIRKITEKLEEAFADPAKFNTKPFVEAAEKLQELVEAGAFNDSMMSMSYDEMVEGFAAGQGAMLYQANWTHPSIQADTAATNGKVKCVAFPVIEGGAGSITEFSGGSSDGYYINSDCEHPKEAVEYLEYLSHKIGQVGYEQGAGLPCWDTSDVDTSELTPLDTESAALMETGTSYISWWDNILSAEDSETYKDLLAQLMAMKITPEEFCESMSKLSPSEFYSK